MPDSPSPSRRAVALRDDMRAYLPGLLPRFVALFGDAERGGGYELVRPALNCLEALGTALEDHLPLLLPALVRLIHPSEQRPPHMASAPVYDTSFHGPCIACCEIDGCARYGTHPRFLLLRSNMPDAKSGVAGTPVEIRRAALHSMGRLLPRMPLAGSAAAVLHPLLRVLDGPQEELRRDAADTICAVALALGPDFALFVPTIRRVRCCQGCSCDVIIAIHDAEERVP